MDYIGNCVFVDKAGYNISMRSCNARSIRSTPVIVETPTTRALSHTILGAISANGVVAVEIREPIRPKKVKVDGSKKKRKPGAKIPEGTVIGHYMRFIFKKVR